MLRLMENDTILTDVNVCLRSDQDQKSNCPGMCSCGCTKSGNTYSMLVDCSSKNLSHLPQFLRKDSKLLKVSITLHQLMPPLQWHVLLMIIRRNTERQTNFKDTIYIKKHIACALYEHSFFVCVCEAQKKKRYHFEELCGGKETRGSKQTVRKNMFFNYPLLRKWHHIYC